MLIVRENPDHQIPLEAAADAVREFFDSYPCHGKRILVLVPDHTRFGPVGQLFQMIYGCVAEQVKAIDVLVALGTHRPMTNEEICQRLNMDHPAEYRQVRLFNHEWQNPETFTTIGKISAAEVYQISEGRFYEEIDVSINKLVFQYDELFIICPVLPHEAVGFSGGHKYIFPGIAEREIINFFHWLSAVITCPRVCGHKWTPPRRIVEKAASFVKIPQKLFSFVWMEEQLKCLHIGEVLEAWERTVDIASDLLVTYKKRPFHTILGLVPKMYDDIWVAGKAMYKLEPVLADGGTLIIYAPHITEISYSHGEMIDQVGYHTIEYFLKQMDRFSDIPRGILAHSTNVKGIGTFRKGVEKPRAKVILATGIPRERCEKVNLGYLDPDSVTILDYTNREEEGVLLVPHAGEMLYRLADGTVPTIPLE